MILHFDVYHLDKGRWTVLSYEDIREIEQAIYNVLSNHEDVFAEELRVECVELAADPESSGKVYEMLHSVKGLV